MRHLYSALLYCLTPLLVLRTLWRSRRDPRYRHRLGERLGFFPDAGDTSRPCIWLHAVSVGEVVAAAPLVERLLSDFRDHRILVTTTTPTGSARQRELFGERVEHAYCPWDLPGAVRRFLRRARPDLLLVMERELWPNLLHLSREMGCGTVLVNGRLSARSARAYGRLPTFSRWLLGRLDVLACQTKADSERFLSLGAPRDRLLVSGSLKWERELDEATRQRGDQLRASLGAGKSPLLLAASTHPGEELLLLEVFARLRRAHPRSRLVLVPRHPERARQVQALCRAAGLDCALFSTGGAAPSRAEVVVGDTLGDLPALYAVASVAFVGGSLVPVGGHNPVEAALWGAPIVSGPHLFNFDSMCEELVAAGGMRVVPDGVELAAVVAGLLAAPERGRAMGQAALGVVRSRRGALAIVLQVIAGQL